MSLRVELNGVKAVGQAKIQLSGITVLSGVNGSGKSTIASMTFDLLESTVHYNKIVDEQIFVEKILPIGRSLFDANNCLTGVAPKNLITSSSVTLLPLYAGFSEYITLDRFNKGLEEFNKVLLSIPQSLNKKQESLVGKMRQSLVPVIGSQATTIPLANIVPVVRELLNNLINSAEMQKATRPISIFQKFWKNTLENGLGLDPGKFNIYEDDLPILDTERNVVSTLNAIDSVFYIDSPMALGEGQSSRRHWKYLDTALRKLSVKKSFEYGVKDGLGLLEGHVKWEKTVNSEKFIYEQPDGNVLDLFNCATGLKSFSILQMLFQNGSLNSKTLLVLDEPEAHLHPQWIVEYARLVVRLHKLIGAKFLIASHNPDMVRAIKYVAEHELENSSDRVSFYIARDAVKPFTYDFECLGMNIAPIFKVFNKSIDKIDEYSGMMN